MAYGPAIEDGVIVGALVLVRDVTVEHRALTDLAASDEHYQMLMSLTSDVIVLTDPVESRYTWVSPSAVRVLGWRHDELIGRAGYDYVHADDLAAVRAARESLLGDVEEATATFRYRRPNGGWIWLESRIRGVPGADGTVTGLLSTSRDVTARKAARGRAVAGPHDVRVGFRGRADRDGARVGRRAVPAGQRGTVQAAWPG